MSTLPRLPDLSDDQKRVLLAEAQGWKPNPTWLAPKAWLNPKDQESFHELPDYLYNERAAITLCDMLGDKGWRVFIDKPKEWRCVFEDEHGRHTEYAPSLATAISNCASLALNLATK